MMTNTNHNINDHDIENKTDPWKEDDPMNTVFNEMVAMSSSFRAVKRTVFALMGMMVMLLLLAFGASFAALKQVKNMQVDQRTNRLLTKDGRTVATIGLGQTFTLPMFSFVPFVAGSDSNNSNAPPRPNPYVCVGVESVVSLWSSAQFGIPTNVLLTGVYEGKFHPESYGAEYGATLTFQGAVQNETHACLRTVNYELQICINFEHPRCGAGSEEKVHEVNPSKFHRRKLFKELVDPNTVFDAFAIDYDEVDTHGGRRLEPRCDESKFGHWCRDYAAIELVGPW